MSANTTAAADVDIAPIDADSSESTTLHQGGETDSAVPVESTEASSMSDTNNDSNSSSSKKRNTNKKKKKRKGKKK